MFANGHTQAVILALMTLTQRKCYYAAQVERLRMTIAERLRFLAQKCDELARTAPDENIRDRHIGIAASYRRLADREQFLEEHEQAIS